MNTIEFYLVAIAALLIFSVIASKATGRFGVPTLVVFLGIGILAGSEGPGGFFFDNAYDAQILGIISLAYILFSSGLDTDIRVIRPVILPGVLLATLGVVITAVLTGSFARYFLGFDWTEGLLLGAIVSSTDAAAVFSVLRARGIHFKGQIRPLLELESGLNDPMGVLLTIAFLQLLTHQGGSVFQVAIHLIQQFTFGAFIGFGIGKGMVELLNRLNLEFDGLYPVMTLAMVVLTYSIAQTLGGNGFLAVYLAGLVMGNQNFVHKKSLVLFHDGIAWLVQILMFLVLGLLVYPSRLVPVAGVGIVISIFLMLVARPVAVFVSTFGSKFTINEKTMVSWVGLRGSVPIILATYPYIAGIPQADMLFHLVFFIVLTSILLQGTSIPLIAKWLKVDAPVKKKIRYPVEYVPIDNLKNDLTEIDVPKQSKANGKSIIELNLPKEALIVLIQRQGNVIIPKGGTRLESGDKLLALSDKKNLNLLREIVDQKGS